MQKLELTGKTFGVWTIIESAGVINKATYWKCKCSCGAIDIVKGSELTRGKSTCCKACRTTKLIARNTTHGMTNTITYNSWRSMIARCTNPNQRGYKQWGGRGIKVCNEWFKFENFYRDMGSRPKGTTIDRKDHNGDYCKDNCCWATCLEQNNNRRSNVIVNYNGQKLTLKQIARIAGITYDTFHHRVTNLGWSVQKAIDKAKESCNHG